MSKLSKLQRIFSEIAGSELLDEAFPPLHLLTPFGRDRARKEDRVSASAGVVLHAKPGDTVIKGQPLFDLRADDADRFPRALDALASCYDMGPAKPTPRRNS